MYISINKPTKNPSLKELYFNIDNISHSNEENDETMNQIRSKIRYIFYSKIRLKKEKNRREYILRKYKSYLHDFKKLIEKQENELDFLLSNDNAEDFTDIIEKLKNQIMDFSVKIYISDLLCNSDLVDTEELAICKKSYTYFLLDKYFHAFEKINPNSFRIEISPPKAKLISDNSNWKNYYYSIIYTENQNETNRLFFSECKNNTQNYKSYNLSIPKSDFLTLNFQGQISKTVFCQRKNLKLTQEELSKISNVDRTMIAKIERVNQPTTLETAIKLLSALNIGVLIYPLQTNDKYVLERKEE